MLISVKMPTIVGILTIISIINITSTLIFFINSRIFMLISVGHENSIITSKPTLSLPLLARILIFVHSLCEEQQSLVRILAHICNKYQNCFNCLNRHLYNLYKHYVIFRDMGKQVSIVCLQNVLSAFK